MTFKDIMFRHFWHNMPQCLFYDNNCHLYSHIQTSLSDRHLCRGTIFPINPFHFRSHAESHTTCRLNNNPNLFPKLKEDGRWAFNASAAELTNMWFGNFDSMVQNMHSTRYHFFLNEMVNLRNQWLAGQLHKRPGVSFFGNVRYSTTQ